MHSLNGKSAVVMTHDGIAISFGKFFVVRDELDNTEHVELAFETEDMSCRIRVHHSKIEAIKRTWSGEFFRYTLPAGDKVWTPKDGFVPPKSAKPVESPIIEVFAPPRPEAARAPKPQQSATRGS